MVVAREIAADLLMELVSQFQVAVWKIDMLPPQEEDQDLNRRRGIEICITLWHPFLGECFDEMVMDFLEQLGAAGALFFHAATLNRFSRWVD